MCLNESRWEMRCPRMAGLWARRELQYIMGRQELRLLIEIFHRAIKELQSKAPQRVVPEKGQTASECRRSLYITSDLILTTTLSSLCFHPPTPPPSTTATPSLPFGQLYCVFNS